MRIKQLMTLGTLGVFLLAGVAFGQNIQTNTTSTTLGSTQFGFAITPAQLGTVMQSTTAPTCGARTAGVMDCTLDNYVKAVGNPGSFTGNPFNVVWATADFGCGAALCGTQVAGGADPQTAPNFGGLPGEANTLTGTITSTVDLGLGTATGDAFHSEGHITFTLDPSTNAATIDQRVVQEINNAAGLTMHFSEIDRTAPGATFTASTNPDHLQGFAGPVNLTAAMTLTQTGDSGIPTATPFTLNVTVPFPYAVAWNNIQFGLTGSAAPPEDAFATPGLNVSPGNPDRFPNFFNP
ncbi:MAG: hypothetical protein MPW14_07795 [Candidatus Manganitrophus sp.]|nr:hypothetical protein [Candidatus Manganitrophus sp.]MDC4223231.1 hypothetical protein [Candidatus Manganitrophus sp.]WDT71095.1 MAG: hypothetical protein MPW17_20515 [Candidatus Manganitrophus sp.]WDT81616.1 MAG: hypothetical protein MPW14_07795 [Candidatus Manganitrophus sp.]